jgi:predicted GTPase
VIAVVGDTGAGKSSLVNALVDQAYCLPTSGMRACTAVVVKVEQNLRNNHYEADVEFLSEEVFHIVHIAVKSYINARYVLIRNMQLAFSRIY